jgi:uncharacterized damage-inducible protein DinB
MEKALYLKRWPVVREGTLEVIDAFNNEDLSYVPVKGGWNVARIMLHIGGAAEYWLHSGVLTGEKTDPGIKRTLENYPTIDVIKTYLADQHRRSMKLLESFDPDLWTQPVTFEDSYGYPPNWIFWHVIEHEIHHRGELSLITGILGHEGLDV